MPATDGQRVFASVGHGQQERLVVLALRASTGKLEWLYREPLAEGDVSVGPGREFSLSVAPRSLAVTRDQLHVGGQQGGVVALAARSA